MSHVLIMAKAPRAGEVKTRLEPLLGSTGCATLQRELIAHTARWTTSVTARVSLAYTPAGARAEIAALVSEAVRLLPQAPGDLGRRLRAATRRLHPEHQGPLAVVGTDAPLLGPVQLQQAWRELRAGHDACIVPALDGGYTMIALAHASAGAQAFALPAQAWGGPRVLERTLSALHDAGQRVALLAPVGDLDTREDAERLLADPRCPPAIHAALAARQAT